MEYKPSAQHSIQFCAKNVNNMNVVSPYAVENVSVGVDADVDVRHDDLVLLGLLLVAEEGVRHPDLGGVRQRQVVQLAWGVAQ